MLRLRWVMDENYIDLIPLTHSLMRCMAFIKRFYFEEEFWLVDDEILRVNAPVIVCLIS